MEGNDWDFPTVARLWDYRTGAIKAGGDKLDALSGTDREHCLTALSSRAKVLTRNLDDGWLVTMGFIMVEDLYRSFFRGFCWTPGVHDYIAATAGAITEELTRRGFVLHYVVDATQGDGNLAQMLAYLPAVFEAAGLAVIGPQLVAMDLLVQSDEQPTTGIAAIQRYRDEGHAIADEVIARWHQDRRSSVYLNLDLDDGLPGLALDVALSQGDTPGTILVFRDEAPTEGSNAYFSPPLGVAMPPGVLTRPLPTKDVGAQDLD